MLFFRTVGHQIYETSVDVAVCVCVVAFVVVHHSLLSQHSFLPLPHGLTRKWDTCEVEQSQSNLHDVNQVARLKSVFTYLLDWMSFCTRFSGSTLTYLKSPFLSSCFSFVFEQNFLQKQS